MKTFQDLYQIVSFNGQKVEGHNDSFSEASKGYKPYQTMHKVLSSQTIAHLKK